ncbi:MAG: SDR family oxidoreductase [Actinobacteria bacterium]|nr:SDR family oxidoreductase [Actinomycetota bacterium]
MSGEFEGRVAIVTGAARGIGREIARQLAERGAAVAVVDVDAQGALEAAEAVGPKALAIACDVSSGHAVAAMVETVIAQLGRIDILVNNAGICERVSVEQITEEQWDRAIAVNLKGTFLVSRAVVPQMKSERSGRIINMASIAGKMGGLMVGLHYAASKGGVLAFTRGLARELAPYGITVNAVCPSMVDTEMGRLFGDDEKRRYLAGVPLGRLATPEDVAAAVIYLASDAASYVTGETLGVNGGLVMD